MFAGLLWKSSNLKRLLLFDFLLKSLSTAQSAPSFVITLNGQKSVKNFLTEIDFSTESAELYGHLGNFQMHLLHPPHIPFHIFFIFSRIHELQTF